MSATAPEIDATIRELLATYGESSRLLVLGMRGPLPRKVDLHKLVPRSAAYLKQSTFKYVKEDPETDYAAVYAGIRLYYQREGDLWLPWQQRETAPTS